MTWATHEPILVILGLSVLDLGPMYETDRHQTKASPNVSAYYRLGIKRRMFGDDGLLSGNDDSADTYTGRIRNVIQSQLFQC